MSKGIIYVLTNPAMPDLVKIGKTTNLEQRLSSLYSTGVPLPFECIYAKEVEDMDFVETKLHAAFDSKRLNNRREFFKILEEELIHFFDFQRYIQSINVIYLISIFLPSKMIIITLCSVDILDCHRRVSLACTSFLFAKYILQSNH